MMRTKSFSFAEYYSFSKLCLQVRQSSSRE